jgi:hypothetical protein
MINHEDILRKFNIASNTSVNKAMQIVREDLEANSDPLYAANAILKKIGIAPASNHKKAFIFVMTAVEQSMFDRKPTIEEIINKANSRVKSITNMLGPEAFRDQEDIAALEPKKGNKRAIAKDIYFTNKDKGDKYVIELIQNELKVSKQNAYTYVYLIKKEIGKQQ